MRNQDYNPVRDSDVYTRLERFQYILFISNIILLIISLANFSICIWIRYIKHNPICCVLKKCQTSFSQRFEIFIIVLQFTILQYYTLNRYIMTFDQRINTTLLFRFDLDFWEWVLEINWYTYWNAM